ncbi:GNAT family N-acetyltransferase [Arsenicicoccus dermatophilus]|uniref:GNAT family N-acetyltransferase n=1 Tax=Arsenicicoccus dermatophilus TaxID=1076331 RepID=UPI003916FFB8
MTAPEICVRPRRDDEVVTLGRLLLEQRPDSRYPYRDPLPFPVEEFVRRRNELAAWVAERDGELLGHVAVGRCTEPGQGDDAASVERLWERAHGRPWQQLGVVQVLFTALAGRGTGVGALLLDTAVAALRERGLAPCLDVLPTHERAFAFYPRHGWVPAGSARPDWLAPDAPDVVAMVLPAHR